MVNCELRDYFKGRGQKWACSKAEGGGGGGGVDLVLGFKNFWDGVYNFFFCPPPRHHVTKKLLRQIVCTRTKLREQNLDLLPMSDRYFHAPMYSAGKLSKPIRKN